MKVNEDLHRQHAEYDTREEETDEGSAQRAVVQAHFHLGSSRKDVMRERGSGESRRRNDLDPRLILHPEGIEGDNL